MRYGRWIAAWFVSGFHDQRAVVGDQVIARYGGLFDAVAQLAIHFTPHDPVGTRHAASALCAVAGIAATWKMAARVVDRRAGFVAAVLLAATPVWLGHGLFNPKDIPFGAAAAWGTWGALRLATDTAPPSYRLSAWCGIGLGAALGVRPGGMFLLAYPCLAWLGRGWLVLRRAPGRDAAPGARTHGLRGLARPAAHLLVCWLAAWMCMLLAWPWAQVSPIQHPMDAVRFASHSSWGGLMLFEGHYVSAQHLPASYLPVWFAISLPETYGLAGLAGIVLLWLRWRRRMRFGRRQLAALGLAIAAFGPVAAQVITHATVYDAQRHFLFVLPPLAALAGAALTRFWIEPRLPLQLRAATLGALVGVLGVVGSDMARLHPYEYVYFNRSVGGLPGAAQRFETEYWGSSYTEAMRWLATQLGPEGRSPLRIATCSHDEAVRQFLRDHPELARRLELVRGDLADILLASTRNQCHKTQGQVLHVVERMGVPLLFVIQRRALAHDTLSNHGVHTAALNLGAASAIPGPGR